MDNSNNHIKSINDLYGNLTYFDIYSGSILAVLFLIIILFCVISYLHTIKNINYIKANWALERCKPQIIPIAGLINKPANMTINEYTSQNYEFCNQQILQNITGYAILPITYASSLIVSLFGNFIKSIDDIRLLISNIRSNLAVIVKDIMSRIMNFIIPLQKIIISFNDIINKVEGIFTVAIYTVFGIYDSLISVLGVIITSITTILIVLAALIVIMWILPFTWGAAIASTITFVSIAVPLALILVFMTNIFHIQPEISIPGIPSMCFDGNVAIKLYDKSYCLFKNVKIGQYLEDGSIITAKMKLKNVCSKMYNLNNVIITPEHLVVYKNKWMETKDHPDSLVIEDYAEKYLYCVNTSSKRIVIGENIFLDWDELYNENTACENIHLTFDGGLFGNTKIKKQDGKIIDIKDVRIDDILHGYKIVYGIVEIFAKDLLQYEYNINGNNIKGGKFIILNPKTNEYDSITNFMQVEGGISAEKIPIKPEKKLYHLLTYEGNFYVGENDENMIEILDYNNNVEFYI